MMVSAEIFNFQADFLTRRLESRVSTLESRSALDFARPAAQRKRARNESDDDLGLCARLNSRGGVSRES